MMSARPSSGSARSVSWSGLRPLLLPMLLAMALAACTKEQQAPTATGPAEVIVQSVVAQPLAMNQRLPGRTVAYMISDVRPQVSGILQKRLFTEGQQVKAGEVLYQIDPATYQAAFDSAKANLAQAEAAVLAARPKAQRYANLLKLDAVSRQAADEAQATLRQNEAAVLAARAALQTARINLDYTRITAPISGVVGTSAYTPGALVTGNQEAPLTTIRQLDPIYVDVALSSAQLLSLRKRMSSGDLKSAGEAIDVRLLLEDGSTYDHSGSLAFIGTSVGTDTGDVLLRALFPNPDGLLLPGMYVRAELPMAINDNAILVPQTAITRNTRGEATVQLVDDGNKLAQRVVELGDAIGDQWVVLSGIQAGDRLVTAGGSRLKPGADVNPVNQEASAETAPMSPVAASAAR
ncbi:efflux RND transporter periplasmic adaptor subunit [Kerstersia gyiorum]|uniref:Multidrug efflux system membrane fusion protein n=1 Tax=Kerstersia gyiorum TaxID=206506 RepID=A0A4Q7ME59_9BURK|nr:efflux RND transporter periplasmic adaptor subunit [Kerstersia gyiorum]MCP1633511.1 multidrug efflux system membrane fusion protein [Kerstersia gyiorum]MCP1637234.1 multidrug efflux system membrane fusion protein [Kerstersia gyiorum]MCP1679693.1 multidrug efflux system membrane fusion protein [Kerstersia gyiorum]MCP1682745.1 multidrug efflux system membrane fusion protein [Kerstersia gyiorum]MCP1713073.1 multidrug efflux system membrane fusion protein [Kerstersia gyiorum]